MYHIYRCVLDVEEDVIRDIKIKSDQSLEDLHQAIVNAFNFSSNEMAAFYKTDDEWTQGDEIPLIDMSDAGMTDEMKDYQLSAVFLHKSDKMLYVYDFLNLWTFFIELHKLEESGEDSAQLVFSTGKLPEQAPEKHFESDTVTNILESDLDFDEAYNDEFGDEFDDDLNVEDLGDYY